RPLKAMRPASLSSHLRNQRCLGAASTSHLMEHASYLSPSERTVSVCFGPARLIHSARSRWPELRTPKIPSGLRTVAPSDFSPPEPSSRRLSLLAVRLRRLRTSREVLVQRGTAKAQLSLREAALTGFIVSLPQAVRQRR